MMKKNSITFRLGLLSLSVILSVGSQTGYAFFDDAEQSSQSTAETRAEGIQQQLLQAQQSLAHRQATRARSILLRMGSAEDFDVNLEQQRLRLLVRAYQMRGQVLKAVRLQASLLQKTPQVKVDNPDLMALWQKLSRLSVKQVKQWLTWVPGDKLTVGWLQLALVMRHEDATAPAWVNAVTQWKEAHPDHAGRVLLPEQFDGVGAKASVPEHIALLLPLTGQYAKQGEAVRRGFYAAYFSEKKQQGQLSPVLQVYDTNQSSMKTLAQQLQSDGITRIVGPLLKASVREFLDHRPSDMPALVLNSVDDSSSGVLQFSLSPEAAIDQLAVQMAQAGLWRVAVLVPDTPMGERLFNRFQENWKGYQGSMVDIFRYSKSADYSAGVKRLFHVDQAKARMQQIKTILHKKLRFVANRRQDVDAVLLIGSRAAAQSLKPLLDFYFSGNLPVYSTSQLLDRTHSKQKWNDLNGLHFLATPWQLGGLVDLSTRQQQVQQQLQATWPVSVQRDGAFYAMGMDAYSLLGRLSMLQAIPAFSYMGATGLLAIDNNNHVFPQLFWASLLHGEPRLLPSV